MGLGQGEMAWGRGPSAGWGPREDATVGMKVLAGAHTATSRSSKLSGSWQPSLGGAGTIHRATGKGI